MVYTFARAATTYLGSEHGSILSTYVDALPWDTLQGTYTRAAYNQGDYLGTSLPAQPLQGELGSRFFSCLLALSLLLVREPRPQNPEIPVQPSQQTSKLRTVAFGMADRGPDPRQIQTVTVHNLEGST